ncbi:MAG: PAS domain-containing sensor histidine kinase, partial [Campylobacterota bacterium]|nr:PAS domain-containing sensor histidine kinase [Campylobacterota bacterium]
FNSNENTIWHSKIDLNIEHGKIVLPIQPTLRIGTPILVDGIKKGILIINIEMVPFLNKLQTASIFNIYLIDSDGNFLVHPNENYSWSKYLNRDITAFDYFKELKKNMLLKNEIIIDNLYINNTTFKNDENLKIIIETKKSKIIDELNEKAKNRLYWLFLLVLIIVAIGYIVFKRRHIQLIIQHNDQLEIQKQKIQNILDTQNSIVILTNGKFILECNQMFLDFFGYSKLSEFTDKYECICDFFEADEHHNYLQKDMGDLIWTEYLLSHKDKVHKVKMTDKDKKTYIFQVNAKIYNINNDQQDNLITFSDVTELENLNDYLEDRIEIEVEKNREKDKQKLDSMSEMIGNIAHQWRQPLSAISTASSGILVKQEFGILEDKDLADTMNTINNTAQKLSKIIDRFGNFIKGDTHKEEFNLSDKILESISLDSLNSKNSNLTFVKNLDTDLVIDNYPNAFIEIIRNIINNSKDVLLKNEEIEPKYIFIDTYKKENDLFITVKDNGGGIDDDILPKIFEAYFTTKHQSQGTGLGLYITYSLVTNTMGGEIDVKNVEYDYDKQIQKGVLFKIKLPII